MNTIASALMLVSSLFNVGVWVICKGLPIFDEEELSRCDQAMTNVNNTSIGAQDKDMVQESFVVKKKENLEVF